MMGSARAGVLPIYGTTMVKTDHAVRATSGYGLSLILRPRSKASFPDFETLAWWASFAPADTPPDVVTAMATASKEILSEPATATQLKDTQHMTLLLQDGAAFKAFFDKQVAYWGKVVKDNNIRA